jgi:hypothetical protein
MAEASYDTLADASILNPFRFSEFQWTAQQVEPGLWCCCARDRSGGRFGLYVAAGWTGMCERIAQDLAALLNSQVGGVQDG